MIVFCVTLLLLHQGYALVPVTTVQLGEPVTFTCVLPLDELGSERLHWYKQSVGDDLKLIVTFRKHTNPVFGPEFSASRLDLKVEKNISKLTILRTTEEDEGMYHCAVIDWNDTFWNGTYLSLKGNTQRTSNYTVVQQPTASDPVRPGDLKTLQCSVLSDSETKTCPGDHSVFWFRVGSDKSHPNILYTDGNRRDECEDRSDTQKSCVHHFSKNISSSDAGTYYCAVATCGEILFGNGDKLEIERRMSPELIALVMAIICLVISLIGNIVFICRRTSRSICEQVKGIEGIPSQARHENSSQPVRDIVEGGDDLNYAALHLTGRKATRGRKKKELKTEESVYSQVRS
ncbi:immunoglobulin superfamily member 3-like [Sparus aurata]|uniref:immunoglobulin superfamily member 3-like n=1 Tax=Sparus aurata TaxID=8175 RepID=UPI0011C0D317|nr:immunoglobulin superfamily member 3-like [Sparus aurata]